MTPSFGNLMSCLSYIRVINEETKADVIKPKPALKNEEVKLMFPVKPLIQSESIGAS